MKIYFVLISLLIATLNANEPNNAQQKQLSEREIYDNARKFVVMISTTAHLTADSWGGSSSLWKGSGFIVNKKKGLIATNKHVMGELSVASYEIKFHDGTIMSGEYVYADPIYDFGIIKVNPEKIPLTATEAEIDQQPVQLNEPIYSIGNSAGDEFSVHKGIIFSIYENLGPFSEQSFQFSGITVGGASGSPIIGENNKVKGILYGGAFISGLGLPINYLHRVIECVENNKDPKRYNIGAIFEYDNATDSLDSGLMPQAEYDAYKKEFPDAGDKIIKVSTRLKNTPAFEQFESGDIIYKINDQMIGPKLFLLDDIIDQAGKTNKSVKISLFRKNALKEIHVQPYLLRVDSDFDFIHFGGALFSDASEKISLRTGIDKGVFILTADATSPFKLGYNFVLLKEIDGNCIQTLSDLEKILPMIMNKKTFHIRYLKIEGYDSRMWGESIIDRESRIKIVKYNQKYDTPKLYKRDPQTKEWTSKIITVSE